MPDPENVLPGCPTIDFDSQTTILVPADTEDFPNDGPDTKERDCGDYWLDGTTGKWVSRCPICDKKKYYRHQGVARRSVGRECVECRTMGAGSFVLPPVVVLTIPCKNCHVQIEKTTLISKGWVSLIYCRKCKCYTETIAEGWQP